MSTTRLLTPRSTSAAPARAARLSVRSLRARAGLVAAGVAAAAALAACTSSESSALSDVVVSGDVGEEPTIETEYPFALTESASVVLVEGDGEVVEEGDRVELDFTAFSGTDGTVVQSSFAEGASPEAIELDPGLVAPAFIDALVGVSVGSRLLVGVAPPSEEESTPADTAEATEDSTDDAAGSEPAGRSTVAGSPAPEPTPIDEPEGEEAENPEDGEDVSPPPAPSDPVDAPPPPSEEELETFLFVLDVLSVTPERATGTEVEPDPSLPAVETDDDGNVTGITIPEGAEPPTELVVAELIEGEGDPVEPDATITAHYTGVLFDTGETFDSSWERGTPATFPLSGVIEGWQEGLTGVPVGSRVVLVIPPEQGYGADGAPPNIPGDATLVFAVDVLASS